MGCPLGAVPGTCLALPLTGGELARSMDILEAARGLKLGGAARLSKAEVGGEGGRRGPLA